VLDANNHWGVDRVVLQLNGIIFFCQIKRGIEATNVMFSLLLYLQIVLQQLDETIFSILVFGVNLAVEI